MIAKKNGVTVGATFMHSITAAAPSKTDALVAMGTTAPLSSVCAAWS